MSASRRWLALAFLLTGCPHPVTPVDAGNGGGGGGAGGGQGGGTTGPALTITVPTDGAINPKVTVRFLSSFDAGAQVVNTVDCVINGASCTIDPVPTPFAELFARDGDRYGYGLWSNHAYPDVDYRGWHERLDLTGKSPMTRARTAPPPASIGSTPTRAPSAPSPAPPPATGRRSQPPATSSFICSASRSRSGYFTAFSAGS